MVAQHENQVLILLVRKEMFRSKLELIECLRATCTDIRLARYGLSSFIVRTSSCSVFKHRFALYVGLGVCGTA